MFALIDSQRCDHNKSTATISQPFPHLSVSHLQRKDWADFKVEYRDGIWGPQEKIKPRIPLLFRTQVHLSLLGSGGETRHALEEKNKKSTYTKFTLAVLLWHNSNRHVWITGFFSHQHELICNLKVYLHSWETGAWSSLQSKTNEVDTADKKLDFNDFKLWGKKNFHDEDKAWMNAISLQRSA